MSRLLLRCGALAAVLLAPFAAPAAQPVAELTPVGTYATGLYDQSAAEIVDYDPATRRAFFVNAQARQVQAVDLTNPAAPVLAFTIPIPGGGPNGIAVRGGIVAVAVEATVRTDAGEVRFYSTAGIFLGAVPAGALPDAVAFDPSGRYVVVANEGEPAAGVNPEGTVSIIDLQNGVASATVATARFTDFNAGGPRRGELNASVLLDPAAASVAQDFEPEYAAILGTRAYVTLQEANAVAVIDLPTAAVVGVYGLGFKDYSLPANKFDASDQDGGVNIRNWPVFGAYQPDAVAAFEQNGTTYLVTANEGDARTDARLSTRTLDPARFPNAATLRLPANLGRLTTIPTTGDDDGDGDVDRIVAFGGRSVSVYAVGPAGLTQTFDSGDQFEQITAARYPANFNASNTNNTLDNRSDDKGPEPEAVTVASVGGRRLAFVGLERIGGVMVYDLTDPAAPTFVSYANNRNFGAATNTPAAGDLGPEAVRFISGGDSPSGEPLLLTSNEISGTVTAYSVATVFALTLLHNNDGESKLLPSTVTNFGEVGGVARFVAGVDRLRAEGESSTDGVLVVSSGDNFLPGPEFNASLQNGLPFYDAVALSEVGYDALAIGNHEFDFGPDVFADFIESFSAPRPPFLSANLDVSAEPRLAALAATGTVARRTVAVVDGRRVGIVGATTPLLRQLSSPRNVVVFQDLAARIQAEVDALTADGVEIVVLTSQLQNVQADLALLPLLRGIDVAVSGGGSELLAGPDDLLIPRPDGMRPTPVGAYPLFATDAAGRSVPVVTTAGDYLYVGRLVLSFDAAGLVTAVNDARSGPVRLVGVGADATAPDASVQANVVVPVRAAVAALASNVVAQSEVPLEGRRPTVRIRETNLGNLLADAILARADSLNESFGAPDPDVAIQNSGGIRNSSLIPAGPISELNTFQIAAFTNFVSVVPGVPVAQFKEILEQAYAGLPGQNGSFAQIAGFRVTLDSTAQSQTVDMMGNVTREGRRVRSVVLDDGTILVDSGSPAGGTVNIATNDFSARGGDAYPFRGRPFTALGETYQQALRAYISGSLGGVIRAADYPAGGEGRIFIGGAVAGDAADAAPLAFGLAGVFPNPARQRATVGVDLAAASDVRVGVYDVLGRRVAAVEAALGAGRVGVALDVSGLAAGAYVVRVTATAGGRTEAATGRLTVVR